MQVLREAYRQHPDHFAIVANLGTAWQLAGNLNHAAECLRQAARIAPEKLRRAERFHWKLVMLRRREPPGSQNLDNLFGVQFVGESGTFEPGKLAKAQRDRLPKDAVAIVQQLALWLPADARLLWLLGELANAHGDVRTAAQILEMCVSQFGLSSRDLRAHRQAVQELAAKRRWQVPGSDRAKAEHAGHAGAIVTRSRRPLASRRAELSNLPPINPKRTNLIPWALLLETQLDRNYRPTFHPHLRKLDNLKISLTGFIQPLTDDLEMSVFMLIEYPTGCWYCEMPEVTGIVLVELPDGKSVTYTRRMVKVTGTLRLNATDPEDFLYTIRDATVAETD